MQEEPVTEMPIFYLWAAWSPAGLFRLLLWAFWVSARLQNSGFFGIILWAPWADRIAGLSSGAAGVRAL